MVRARNPNALPSRISLFPLSGVTLLPFGHVPLNVFEPRYLNMVDDALGAERVIGVIQPRDVHADPVPDDTALFDVGTAGRIVQFHDSGNGRYAITLEGMSRFRLAAKPVLERSRGYRTVHADYVPYAEDLNPTEHDNGPGRARIIELMRAFFADKDIEADWDSVSAAPYEALVTSLAMTCPFEPREKQALLECPDHASRAGMLISLFEMDIEGAGAPGPLKH